MRFGGTAVMVRRRVASRGTNSGLPPRESTAFALPETSLVAAGLLLIAQGADRTRTGGAGPVASSGRSLRCAGGIPGAGTRVHRHGAATPGWGMGELDDQGPRARHGSGAE